MKFADKLLESSQGNSSLLCVGLDPDPELMPSVEVSEFILNVIDATADLVCAYKPNLAFYEALGRDGIKALERIRSHIPNVIPVIGDAKRGDIASSSRAYARAMFDVFSFDAVTVNPYLGYDAIAPFLEHADRGAFILCRTSNPGARDFQDIVLAGGREEEARPLFELVALKALEWNHLGNIGLVVGSTYPEELKRIRELCPRLPFLIPGVGTQGGDLELAVKYGVDARGGNAIINVSRQVLYASRGKDYAAAARKAALRLRDEINYALVSAGFHGT